MRVGHVQDRQDEVAVAGQHRGGGGPLPAGPPQPVHADAGDGQEAGFDRPGGDYSSATVPNGDPAVCAARCEHETRCRAWSFSYPTASGGPAMCWLKRDVVPRVEASCCVSGVRGAGVIEPRAGDVEFSIDRYGGDYRSFETTPDPKATACAASPRPWVWRR